MIAPHDRDAEIAVLGSILIDESALRLVDLKPEHFFIPEHQRIFEAMLNLDGIDQMTVAYELKRLNKLEEIGGAAYLSHLVAQVPTSLHAPYYAGIVKECAIQRQLVSLAAQLVSYAAVEPSSATISKALSQLLELSSTRENRGLQPIAQVSSEHIGAITSWLDGEREIKGLMTGFKDIDRVIDGLEKGKLYIIAARPSMGKTMLCLNIARNLALGGAKVGFFSLEQHRKALLERLVFAECRINRFALRGADSDRDKFWDAWAVVEKLPIYVNDATRILTDTVMTEVMSLRISQGIDILFFDYISLAGDKDEHSEVRRIGNIVKNLQRIARLAEIPVIAVSQLSRAPEHRQERRPGLSDLRDSGEIEQDADVVIGLYRDEFYHANTEEPHNLECIILKNRDGARGTVKLYYDATTGFMGDKVKS